MEEKLRVRGMRVQGMAFCAGGGKTKKQAIRRLQSGGDQLALGILKMLSRLHHAYSRSCIGRDPCGRR